jgi:hypothetical protein
LATAPHGGVFAVFNRRGDPPGRPHLWSSFSPNTRPYISPAEKKSPDQR